MNTGGFLRPHPKDGDVLIKNYFVWLTADSEVVKKTQDGPEPSTDNYCWSALSEVARRFEESGYRVPDENGLDASTTTAESKIISSMIERADKSFNLPDTTAKTTHDQGRLGICLS